MYGTLKSQKVEYKTTFYSRKLGFPLDKLDLSP